MGNDARSMDVRHLGIALYQRPVCPDDARATPLQRTRRMATCSQSGIHSSQCPGHLHQSGRQCLFPIHRPTHHSHYLQRVQQRRESGKHHRHRTAEPLVPGRSGHRTHLWAQQSLCATRRQAVAPTLRTILHHTDHLPGPLHTPMHLRHEGRCHHCRAPHHHQQCQPVCRPPGRSRLGAEHPLLAYPHTRQEALC